MLGPQKALIKPPPPCGQVDPREPSPKKVQEVVEGAISASGLGPRTPMALVKF